MSRAAEDLKAAVTIEVIPHPVKEYVRNDAGRAERFVDAYANEIRFVPAWNRWLSWSGIYWRPDEDNGITRLAIRHSQKLICEASEITDLTHRERAVKDALDMGNGHQMHRMLDLAKCDSRIIARHTELDSAPFLLGVENGTIDLKTGEFKMGDRADLITKRAGTKFVKDATCPRWEAFLGEVFSNNAELASYIQKLVGYTLTGDVREQCFPFLFGRGKNGKSVFTEILQSLLGDYGQRATQGLLAESNNGREPTHEIARLHGARLVLGSETEEGARLAEGRVKNLTGGDTVSARFLYSNAFDFRPVLKLWMFGNHKPEIRGTDEGIWRRVRLIPFTVQIPEACRDAQLTEKLRAELPGILQWAIEGVRLWLASGLNAPAIVSEFSSEYRRAEDTLGEFLAEETECVQDTRTEVRRMFERYMAWATRNGIRAPLSQRGLAKRLIDRGLSRKRASSGNSWEGVSLRFAQARDSQ